MLTSVPLFHGSTHRKSASKSPLGKWVGQHVQWSAREKDVHADSTLHDVLQFASKEALLGTLQNFFLPPYCYTGRAEFCPSPFLGVSGM